MKVPFEKWHGLGNDFVLVQVTDQEMPAHDLEARLATEARTICDRNTGIGADGLVLTRINLDCYREPHAMRIFNPDGSEAEMCGNAIRCVGVQIHELLKKYSKSDVATYSIQTKSGTKLVFVNNNGKVSVNMGEPVFNNDQCSRTSPNGRCPAFALPKELGDGLYGRFVSMGNPHLVVVDFDNHSRAFDDEFVRKYGPPIENLRSIFPQGTNVEFVNVLSKDEIKMKVWERGAGITKACGTGACASAVACSIAGHTNSDITVHLDGGDLEIEWDKNGYVQMTGPAKKVFEGAYDLK